jgi:hypothetical protein
MVKSTMRITLDGTVCSCPRFGHWELVIGHSLAVARPS